MTEVKNTLSQKHFVATGLKLVLGLSLMALFSGSFGCADGEVRLNDPFDRQDSLQHAQHRYTVLIRWTQFQKAKRFVAPDSQDAFIERMEALEEARFTDYESEPIELDKSKGEATMNVTYTFYTPNVPYELEIVETQVWTRNGIGNAWVVDSYFEGLDKLALR